MKTQLVVWLLVISLSGCTVVPLRRNSVDEAQAVCDLETQQVLNNLAKFVYDPNSMPYFSYPTQNSASVADTKMAGRSPRSVFQELWQRLCSMDPEQ